MFCLSKMGENIITKEEFDIFKDALYDDNLIVSLRAREEPLWVHRLICGDFVVVSDRSHQKTDVFR